MSTAISIAELKEFVVDHLNIGVFSVDKEMNVLLWNGFMENNTHIHAKEVVGNNLFEVFPELPQKWLTRKFKSVFILKNFAFSSWRQRPFLFRFSHNRPITGGIDCMRQDLILMPVKGSSGNVEAVNVALMDMTDVSIFQGMMAETMDQMETLDSIVKTINQETELDGLINTVIEQGLILFPQADNGICWLLNANNQFQCAAMANSAIFSADPSNTTFIDNLSSFVKTLTIDHNFMSQLYTANADSPDHGIYHSYQCNDIQDSKLAQLTYQQSTLTIALIREDKIIGYLVFNNYYDDEAFTHVDLPKLKRFREHTVSAISKAKFLKAIAEESEKIKNLLDNAGQGFLSFTSDLTVADEYSAECLELFGRRIDGCYFPALIKPEDPQQQAFLTDILTDIFSACCDHKLFLPLLPEETVIGNTHISIEYRPIRGKSVKDLKLLVILTDITETRVLESKIEQERNCLQMIVTAVSKRYDTTKAITDYQTFCKTEINEILASNATLKNIIFDLFRQVHTFKGSFSQLDFVHVISHIHGFETQLSELRRKSDSISKQALIELCQQTPMLQWLEADLSILKNALGEDYLEQQEILSIDINRLREIETNMLRTLSPVENQIFLPQLRQLKAKPLSSMIVEYSEYMTRIAESLDKAILPMVITGDEVLVDPNVFGDFTTSLIHVFRNTIDHGIETMEDRIELGKEEFGLVTCNISHHGNLIILKITDDGCGIDTETLRAQFIHNQLMSETQAKQLTDEQIIGKIFDEQVSSRQQVSELSGRGIGLSAVKHALQKLGGSVKVKSEQGKGTQFYFSLPFKQILELPQVNTASVVDAVINQTLEHLTNEIDVLELRLSDHKSVISEQLELKELTTFIRIKGLLEGTFLFSFERPLAQKVARNMLISLEDDESDMLPETITEICNIILGNSMEHFPGINELVMIDVPISLNTRTSTLKNLSVDVITTNISTKVGCISVSFISS